MLWAGRVEVWLKRRGAAKCDTDTEGKAPAFFRFHGELLGSLGNKKTNKLSNIISQQTISHH